MICRSESEQKVAAPCEAATFLCIARGLFYKVYAFDNAA